MKQLSRSGGEFLVLADFKRVVVDFNVELIRGVSMNDNDFHEYCREMFSLMCKPPPASKPVKQESSAKRPPGPRRDASFVRNDGSRNQTKERK